MHPTRSAALAVLAGVLAAGVACTNSGLGQTGDSSDTGSDGPPVAASCDWSGEWQLSTTQCGSFEIGGFFDAYDSVVMTIADAEGGGCDVELAWSGPGCGEQESLFVGNPAAGEVSFEGAGITSCQTEGCTFEEDEAACEEGDRAETFTVTVDDSTDGQLVLTGLGAHAWPACSLDFVTTWDAQ